MLADFLKDDNWQSVIDGVQMCKLSPGYLQEGLYPFPEATSSHRLEFFFCCGGSFLLARKRNPPMRIGEQDIFFFSDFADISTIQITDSLMGYCISVDSDLFQAEFENFYRLFGHTGLYKCRISETMHRSSGCVRIHSTPWSRSAFSILSSLPYEEQGRYCFMKIVELVYLICAQNALLEGTSELAPSLGYSPRIISKVRSYMESHLDEKLTIMTLSRKFNLSSTALKNGFRSLYGQPVHTWLQEKRIQRAAELLSFSDLTVLQIAQTVGYEGVSQFNVIFKRQYGITPSQYRKMSDPVRI